MGDIESLNLERNRLSSTFISSVKLLPSLRNFIHSPPGAGEIPLTFRGGEVRNFERMRNIPDM